MSLKPPIIDLDDWHHAGDVAQTFVIDIANKAKDKADTELDAKRVHDGMTLDQFLGGEKE